MALCCSAGAARAAAALKVHQRQVIQRAAQAKATATAGRVKAIQDARRSKGLKPLDKAALSAINKAANPKGRPKKKAVATKPIAKPTTPKVKPKFTTAGQKAKPRCPCND